ncbi:MAG: tail completion protein gp17, partial [Bosea sp. (in: a-proteobacteria)]
MMDAVIAVRRAIQARLVGDTNLNTLLGGPRIHDEPLRAATGPYVVYG